MKTKRLRKAYEYAVWHKWGERDRKEAEEMAELMQEKLQWLKSKKKKK